MPYRSMDGFMSVFSNIRRQRAEFDSTLFHIGVLILFAAFAGVFLVLLPFLSPLLWAFLMGAVLFPAKKKVSRLINRWISDIEVKETPIAISLMTLPFTALVKLGEVIAREFLVHMKILLIGLGSIISLRIIAYFAPREILGKVLNLVIWFHTLFGNIVGVLSVTSLVILIAAYAVAVYMLWSPSNSRIFTTLGQGIWVLILAFLCTYMGSFQIPAFACALTYGLIGVIYDEEGQIIMKIKAMMSKKDDATESSETSQDPLLDETPKPSTSSASQPENTPLSKLMKTKIQLSEIKQRMQLNLQSDDKCIHTRKVELESDKYFKILFYSCIATLLWSQMWIFFLSFIPITLYALKELCRILGFGSYIEAQWKTNSSLIENWLAPRRDALIPVCLPGVVQLNLRIHKFLCAKLKSFVDDISAVVMILILVVGAVVLSLFFFFQVYSETIAVAHLSSDLVNRTLTHRPDLVEMLPINMQSMNDVIDNAYQYSRGMIETYLDNIFNSTDPEQSRKLKDQILSVWDRLVQSYMDKSYEGVGPRVPTDSVMTTLDEIMTTSGGEQKFFPHDHCLTFTF